MNKQNCKALGLLGSAFLAGCTTYFTSKPADISSEPITGVLYSLPMLQYDFVVTRRVATCNPLSIASTVDVSARYIADPFATFNLDYQEMAGITSTSEFDVTLSPDSRLKSINASADDKTGEILQSSFSVLSNVALAQAGVPSAGVAAAGTNESSTPPADSELPECSTSVNSDFLTLKGTERTLKQKQNEVQTLTSEIERLNLLIATTGGPTDSIVKELNEKVKQLQKASSKLSQQLSARGPIVSRITQSEKHSWPKSSEDEDSEKSSAFALLMPRDTLESWWANYEATKKTKEGLKVIASIDFTTNLTRLTNTASNIRPDINIKGIHYRHPVPVQLDVCAGIKCKPDLSNRLKTDIQQSPQHGPFVTLPFNNKAFQNNKLAVTFNDNGVPEKLTFKNQKAAFAEATGALSNIVKQLPGIRQQLLGSELEALKRETALAEEASKLQTAEAASEISPTADLEAQKALIDANIALITAQIAQFDKQKELDTRQNSD